MPLLWETGNQKPFVVTTGQMLAQMLVPQNKKKLLSGLTHHFCGWEDHRRGRETNFLTDSSFNIQQNVQASLRFT